jgi:riboflavin kinase/FMN adenylyltransferase
LKIYNSIASYKSAKKAIVTIGTFDGVHIGHQKIIEKLTQNAKNLDCESLVLTFFPHPRMVLQGDSDIKLLNTIDEKALLLEKAGVDNLIIHPFDQAFSRLTAEEFVSKVLVDAFHVKKIIIGHDHRFGRNRTATINDLELFGKQYDFEVEQISVQEINEVAVSSTKIRTALETGNVALANTYLGYEYLLSGIVCRGKQLGRTIGFPTANIQIQESYKLIPKQGVYIVKSTINGNIVFGMMNIGFNPTVNGLKLSVEVHFLDFDSDLYDKILVISVLERIREEQKFESIDDLKEQLNRDKEYVISYLKNQFI